jgi:tetratricopeptide (TPR) repeat protein
LTQGVPLALEQAASLIRVSQANEIADRIEESLDSLSTTLQNLPVRHRSMRAVFDGSWSWLTESERMVFCRLSVFQGSFSRAAAEQMAGASLSSLAALVDKSLLRRGPELGKTTRYDLHELVCQYAAIRLLEFGPSQVAQVHESHLDFYLSMAEQADKFWDTAQEREWLERLEVERVNILAALQWGLENEKSEQVLRMNAALINFWMFNSPAGEANKWIESSLSMAWDEQSNATIMARAKALNVAGYANVLISDLKLAEKHFDEGVKLYSRLGDLHGRAWSLRGCGFVCKIRGDLAGARTYLRESQDICEEIQDGWGLAWAIHDLGEIALAGGDLPQAKPLLKSGLEQFRQIGTRYGTLCALINLGYLGRAQEKWAQAKAFYSEALAVQQETQYIVSMADVLEGLANIALADNNPKIAVQLFGAAQARRDAIEMARWGYQEKDYQRGMSQTRNRLPAAEWQAAWDKGYEMSPQQGLAFTRAALPTFCVEKKP